MTEKPLIYAIMAEFESPASLLKAAEATRSQGFTRWDVFSPFPVRGMNRAMGLHNSRVGWCAFAGAAMGFLIGLWLVWWTNAQDYPLIVGGKPLFSPWSAFPVAFECAVLLGSLGAFAGLLFLTRLPRLHHPLLKKEAFAKASHDRFYLVIETADPKYSETRIRRFLEQAGGKHIELIEE